MSLLKRIESARPGAAPGGPTPAAPAPAGPGGPQAPVPTSPAAPRLMSQGPVRESFRDVKFRIQNRVIQDLDPKLDLSNQVEVRRQIEEIFGKVIDEEGLALTRAERVRMLEQILDETFGFGPLELLLKDEKIADIMINGPRKVFVEKDGQARAVGGRLPRQRPPAQIIDRIVSPVGRRVDETSPMVDARLPNGSRFNAIIPPLALTAPVVTIRMFGSKPLTKDDLLRFKAFTPEMLAFMEGAMKPA